MKPLDNDEQNLLDVSLLIRSNATQVEEKKVPPAIQQFLAEYSLESLPDE